MTIRILRLSEVMRLTGYSRSSIYARIASGQFPAQVPLSPYPSSRAVGWIEGEVMEIIAQCIATRDLKSK